MIPDQYPNYYKALEIYTGYFNSLDNMILLSYPSSIVITRDYCSNATLPAFSDLTRGPFYCFSFLEKKPPHFQTPCLLGIPLPTLPTQSTHEEKKDIKPLSRFHGAKKPLSENSPISRSYMYIYITSCPPLVLITLHFHYHNRLRLGDSWVVINTGGYDLDIGHF